MEKQDRRKPDAPGAQGTMAKFMEPCLLLLLQGERAHGYELMEKLSSFGFEGTSSDMATLYRTLRQLGGCRNGCLRVGRRVARATQESIRTDRRRTVFLDDWHQ